jgi:hypothetical protein
VNSNDVYSERIAGVAGIVSVVTSALGTFIVGAPPAADATMEKIRAYYAHHRTELLVQMLLLAVGAVALIMFVGGLRSYLRRRETAGNLSGSMFGAGITVAILVLVGLFLEIGLIYRVAPAADDVLLRAFFDALTTGAVFFAFPIALYVGAATVVAKQTGALPNVIVWIGVVTVIGNLAAASQLFVDSGPWTPGGSATFIPFLLLAIWEVAVAVAMIRRPSVALDAP